jgi:hypothetical protein
MAHALSALIIPCLIQITQIVFKNNATLPLKFFKLQENVKPVDNIHVQIRMEQSASQMIAA